MRPGFSVFHAGNAGNLSLGLLARLIVVALLATLAGLLLLAAVLAALTRILCLLSRLLIALVLTALVLLTALVWIIHFVPLGLSRAIRQLPVTTDVPRMGLCRAERPS